jgi:hypothetical protein
VGVGSTAEISTTTALSLLASCVLWPSRLYGYHSKTVTEKGGNAYGVAGWKLLTVVLVVFTTELASFVSVSFAEVSWLTVTAPVGALAPLKVTGRDAVLLRLMAITLLLFAPSLKANVWSS